MLYNANRKIIYGTPRKLFYNFQLLILSLLLKLRQFVIDPYYVMVE